MVLGVAALMLFPHFSPLFLVLVNISAFVLWLLTSVVIHPNFFSSVLSLLHSTTLFARLASSLGGNLAAS